MREDGCVFCPALECKWFLILISAVRFGLHVKKERVSSSLPLMTTELCLLHHHHHITLGSSYDDAFKGDIRDRKTMIMIHDVGHHE